MTQPTKQTPAAAVVKAVLDTLRVDGKQLLCNIEEGAIIADAAIAAHEARWGDENEPEGWVAQQLKIPEVAAAFAKELLTELIERATKAEAETAQVKQWATYKVYQELQATIRVQETRLNEALSAPDKIRQAWYESLSQVNSLQQQLTALQQQLTDMTQRAERAEANGRQTLEAYGTVRDAQLAAEQALKEMSQAALRLQKLCAHEAEQDGPDFGRIFAAVNALIDADSRDHDPNRS